LDKSRRSATRRWKTYSKAPEVGDDVSRRTIASCQEIEAAVDALFNVLFLKQLGYPETASKVTDGVPGHPGIGNNEAMLSADAQFLRDAEEATR
jgi:hypothetical protein